MTPAELPIPSDAVHSAKPTPKAASIQEIEPIIASRDTLVQIEAGARVQVAPEFAAPPHASGCTPSAKAKTLSDAVPLSPCVAFDAVAAPIRTKTLPIFAAVGLVLIGGLAFLFLGKGSSSLGVVSVPAGAASKPAIVQSPTTPPTHSASRPVPEPPYADKAFLNNMMKQAEADAWADIDSSLVKFRTQKVSAPNPALAKELAEAGLKALVDGDIAKAEEYLLKAVQQDGNDPTYRSNLAFTYLRKNDQNSAQQRALESLLTDPSRGAGWRAAAEVFAERDNLDAAISALRLALHFAANRDTAVQNLSAISYKSAPKFAAVVKAVLPGVKDIPAYIRP